MSQQREHAQGHVTAEPLVRATVDALPGGPALLALARFKYAPKAKFGPAAGPGPVAFRVESGTLLFSADNQVYLKRSANSHRLEQPTPGSEFHVGPDDELLVPGNVTHQVRNPGSSAATILGAATFPGGAPPKNFPDGVTFQPLVMNMVDKLAPAPAQYALDRVTFGAGTNEPDTYYAGPGLHYVESGTLELQVVDGTAQVMRDLVSGRVENVGPGGSAQVNAGQGVVVPAGATATVGNAYNQRPAVVLTLRTAAAFLRTPKDIKQVLPDFIHTVMDGANPDAVGRFLAPNFFSHDLPPTAQIGHQKTGGEGVADFLRTQILPSFSHFKTSFPTLIQENDMVAAHWVQSFDHTGNGFFGVKATGRNVTIDGFTIARIKDGKIVEHWEERDFATWYKRIGLPFPLGSLEGGVGLTGGNKDVVRKYWSAWQNGDPHELETVLAQGFTNHHVLTGQQPGRDGIAQLALKLRDALAGFQVTIDLLLTDGSDKVFSRVRYSGTHRAPLFGIPATGKPIEVAAIDLFSIHDGVVTERWGQLDDVALATQLGLFSLPGAAAGAGAAPSPSP